MDIRVNKAIRAACCAAASVFLLAGCAKGSETAQEQVNAPAETQKTTEPEAFVYEFNPHVLPREYRELYGTGFETDYAAFCDAVLSGQDTFPCESSEQFYRIMGAARFSFPLALEMVDADAYRQEGERGHITYRYESEEVLKKSEAFRETVSANIQAAIPYEEPAYIKAMELFTFVARKDAFDESHTLSDMLKTRPYRAIMDNTGICQEIAGEYIYYLLQIGINAIPCSSLNADESEAHEWCLLELDGTYYHADPTFAVNYPDSLFFFGMNDRQREYYGSFPPEKYTFADTDIRKPEYQVSDDRFMKFWLAERYEIDHAGREISITEHETGTTRRFPF